VHGDPDIFDSLGVAAGHDDFPCGFDLVGEVALGGSDAAGVWRHLQSHPATGAI
jgi:hypothetical protein